VLAVWAFLGWERMGVARGMGKSRSGERDAQDHNFTVTGSKAVADVDVSLRELMTICLAENDRRFAGYDTTLCRPTTMPWLVRTALRVMPVRRPSAT